MTPVTLTNLLAWALQAVLLAAAASLVLRVFRVDAPVIRHAVWRIVLVVCLALPLIQPWRPPLAPDGEGIVQPTSAAAGVLPALVSATDAALSPRPRPMESFAWPAIAWAVVAAGAALHLAWLAVGLVRLRSLRKAGCAAGPGDTDPDVASLLEAGAEIRFVEGLGQPVTFGARRPVVLLPSRLRVLPAPVQRAVLVHELWHVRRRDWLWVLAEETLRALLWFHPAIGYLVSRIQSSREEVVDELTVLVTNSRRSYLEALLAFADRPRCYPATPFARRRHLFHRMLLISREAPMSSRRITVSSMALAATLVCAAWVGAGAFPLTSAAMDQQAPPRDPPPGQARPATARELELQKTVEVEPSNVRAWLEIAKLQEARNALEEAESTLLELKRTAPGEVSVYKALAGLYKRTQRFDLAIGALEEAAALDPANPQGYHTIAVHYWEKAFRDPSVLPAEKAMLIRAGITAEDLALTANPDYVEALIYKNILLRMQSQLENDPARRAELTAEADRLRNRAMELRPARQLANGSGGAVGVTPPPPPPPPPPPSGIADPTAPLRVGGNIAPPRKIKDVRPLYPPEAKEAGIQGVVIVEITVGADGRVQNPRVLRSIPMLDQAALDAVSQWEFEPTLLNGAPVPVILTVTVNFTLERQP